jgi:hypothetical protein
MELLCRDHGGQGIEISVRMTGDDFHRLTQSFEFIEFVEFVEFLFRL